MAKLNAILVLLIVNLVVVGTASAAIQLNLTNNSTSTYTYPGPDTLFDLITKTGSGIDIIPISLTNTGDTIISAGVLKFKGGVTDLHTVVGSSSSSLGIGDDGHSSNLTANSICVGTLTVTAGSTITIRAIPGGPLSNNVASTPEPISWVIWLLIGLIAVVAYRRRR
jgi:hypothetical protein